MAVDRERGIVFAFGFFDHEQINWTWQFGELLKIEKGQIRRIEAVFHRCPYGMNSGWSTYEQGMSDQIQRLDNYELRRTNYELKMLRRRSIMRMKLFAIAAISLLVLIVAACQRTEAPSTETGSTPAAKSTCDRACLESYVDKYMDAMLAHEPSKTLFAENIRFTENGVQLPFGNEGLWASMVGKGTYKFYIPDVETQQVAFIGTAREETQTPGVGNPVAVALHLKIQNGLISEAEQLVIRPESNLFDPTRKPAPSAAEKYRKNGCAACRIHGSDP